MTHVGISELEVEEVHNLWPKEGPRMPRGDVQVDKLRGPDPENLDVPLLGGCVPHLCMRNQGHRLTSPASTPRARFRSEVGPCGGRTWSTQVCACLRYRQVPGLMRRAAGSQALRDARVEGDAVERQRLVAEAHDVHAGGWRGEGRGEPLSFGARYGQPATGGEGEEAIKKTSSDFSWFCCNLAWDT